MTVKIILQSFHLPIVYHLLKAEYYKVEVFLNYGPIIIIQKRNFRT